MAWEEKLKVPSGTPASEAKVRQAEWLGEIEGRISALRAAKTGAKQVLGFREVHALGGEWYKWFIEREQREPRPPSYWGKLSDNFVWDVLFRHAPQEHLADPHADVGWEWKAAPEVRAAVRPLIAQEAKVASFLLEKGIALNDNTMARFLDVVEDNLLIAFTRLRAMARGDFSPDPTLEAFPAYKPEAAVALEQFGCWTLFERWQKDVKPAPSTVARWTAIFKEADRRFPNAKNVSFEEVKSWMTGLINGDRSAKTVATVWKTALKTVFTWSVREKLVLANPFKEIRISVPREDVERETKAFTVEEAETILRASLAVTRVKTIDDRARRWVPWLCAYTGARAGEITQLRGSDVFARGGYHFAKLSPSAGKIKTRKARTVPLHEHLVAQGFLAFVENAGSGPLFYDPARRRPSDTPEPVQNQADRTRGRLGDWVRKLGITDPELSPNHAWRHTFKARAERYGMSERYSDTITGHAPPTTGRTYGKPTPEDLAQAMQVFPRYDIKPVT